MDLAVAELLEQEEQKVIERKRREAETAKSARPVEENYIPLSDRSTHTAFQSKYRTNSPPPPPKRELFGGRGERELFRGRGGSANRYLKYEDENDSSNQRSSPKTSTRDTPERPDRGSRDVTRGASDAESANGSVRSSRRRTRSPSTGRHSRRGEHGSRYDNRHRDSRHDSDRHYRSRRDPEEYDRNNRSSCKRRASDDVDLTDAPPSSRGRYHSPRGERPGSSHNHDRPRRDDRQRDDRYAGHRREPYRKRTPEPTDDERDLRTVFCQQLAARLRTRELKEFFEKNVGPVQDAQIVKDRVSQRSKG